jgi:hypothetical protein
MFQLNKGVFLTHSATLLHKLAAALEEATKRETRQSDVLLGALQQIVAIGSQRRDGLYDALGKGTHLTVVANYK